MTPMNLPLQPTTSPAPAQAPTSAAAAQAQSTDFLLMLEQLAAASIPSAAAAPLTASAAPAAGLPLVSGVREQLKDELKKDEMDAEELLAMFSMALPMQPTPPPAIDARPGEAMQSLPTVGLGGASSVNAAIDGASAQLLAEVVDEIALTSVEVPQGGDSFQLPAAPVELQQQHSRALQAHEAAARVVHSPVGGAAWAEEIGTRVVMMSESGNHTASLRLSPEHLGPLEISIVIRDDKTSVWFGAAHADTRAAIETALPRLREMFESQGLSLADAGVFREPPRERASSQARAAGAESGAVEETASAINSRVHIGLVDAYA